MSDDQISAKALSPQQLAHIDGELDRLVNQLGDAHDDAWAAEGTARQIYDLAQQLLAEVNRVRGPLARHLDRLASQHRETRDGVRLALHGVRNAHYAIPETPADERDALVRFGYETGHAEALHHAGYWVTGSRGAVYMCCPEAPEPMDWEQYA